MLDLRETDRTALQTLQIGEQFIDESGEIREIVGKKENIVVDHSVPLSE